MINIGEAFSFYVKHCSEMETLYVDEEYKLLPEMEENKHIELEDKINRIGDQASIEAAQFLQKITDILMSSLEGKAGTAQLSRKSTMEKNWYTEIQIWADNKASKPRSWDYTMGAHLLCIDNTIKLLIWAWTRNSKSTPVQIVERLKSNITNSRFNLEELNRKSVVLNVIELNSENNVNHYNIDQTPILDACKKTSDIFSATILSSFLKDFC